LPPALGQTYEEDSSTDQSVQVVVVSADVLSQDFGYAMAQLCGQVKIDGKPVASATVKVVDSAGNPFTTKTDAAGRYCVDGTLSNPLYPGVANVTATTTDGTTVSGSVPIASAKSAVRDLEKSSAAAPSLGHPPHRPDQLHQPLRSNRLKRWPTPAAASAYSPHWVQEHSSPDWASTGPVDDVDKTPRNNSIAVRQGDSYAAQATCTADTHLGVPAPAG